MMDLAPHWLWWALAVVLLILELLSGSGFLLAIAIAATLTGILAYAAHFLIWNQMLIFALVALTISILWWFLSKRLEPISVENPLLNQRLQKMVGQRAQLTEAIVNGRGHIKLGDTVWLVTATEDIAVGTTVMIIAVQGATLVVTCEGNT